MKKFYFFCIACIFLFAGANSAWAETWTVAGSSTAIINGGNTWSPTTTSNDMANVTGTWWALKVTGKTLANSTNYQCKVCKDHAWTTAYPASNYDMYITTGGSNFSIIYTYNSSNNDVTAVPFTKWTVVGSSDVLGSNWNTTDNNNKMTMSSTYVYTLTKENVHLTGGATYECKVVPDNTDGEWKYSYPSSNKTFSATMSGDYNVTFEFNIVTKAVTVTLERIPEYRTIYFINSSGWTGTMKCHVWKDGGATLTSWPGANMTNTGLTDDCGHTIWSYDLDIAYDRVIFNNGSSQTGNLTPNLTNTYYHHTNNAWYSTPPAECSDIYFINTEGWTNVYCYAWDPGNNGSFPGAAMTNTGTTICGKPVYKYHLTGSYSHCVFSAGADKAKTRDLNIVPEGYFNYGMQQWYADASTAAAACVTSTGAPIMTYGEPEVIYPRKAEIQVGAIDDNTPFEEIVYYCELATPMGETYQFYQITFFANKPGYFDLINLIPCSEYVLTVWAIDNDGNVSEDPKVISFKTECDALNLYLRGDMNSWATNNEDWQFQYHTYEHDRFILIRDIDPGQKYRLWDNGYSVYGPTEAEQQPLYTGDHDGVVVFTATGTTAYVSSLDEIYVVGPAVAGGADDWDLTNARKLTWDNAISATWEGNVTNGAQYKLVVRHTSKGGGDAYVWDCWDYFGAGNATYNEAFTHAILTFDLLTWTWTWKNADDNLCAKTGFPPAGLKASEFPGTKAFQMGYEVEIYTPTATQLIVTAKSNDWAKRAGSVAPYFLLFTEENIMTGKVLEKRMVEAGRTDANGNKYYTLTINLGDKADNYTSDDLVADFTMGACIRFSIKFPYAGGFSTTDPLYYYIRQGCAPYYFEIYHHDDSPGTKDAITQFDGGEILQPIIYRRKFNPGAWETLCLPFTCSAVRVYDESDKMEYDLVPQHGTEDAGYWLRTFSGATEREEFKPHWSNVPAGVNLPQKDVPYIMMVPDVGGYYDDKYVMFYGKGYQTIDQKDTWGKQLAPSTGFFYYPNTTMYPQDLGQAYMISGDGWWFVKSTGNTLYPFECYVVADAATTARFSRMGYTEAEEEQIATGLPSTGDSPMLQYRYDGSNLYLEATANTPLAIYSVDGQLIVASSLQANMEKTFVLPRGIYIVQTQVGLTKLAL